MSSYPTQHNLDLMSADLRHVDQPRITTTKSNPNFIPLEHTLSRNENNITVPFSERENQPLDDSSSDTGISTPRDPQSPFQPHLRPTLEVSLPQRVKSRTTEYCIHRINDQSHPQFWIGNGGALASGNSLQDDYGLGELRAPPILPDRERRKSLESAWSRPESPRKAFWQRVHDDFVVGSWITFFAIWGSLARIELSALTTYPGQPVFPLIWSQFVGCVVMGFLLQDKVLFPKEDRYVPLYIGLTTGFCGSVTSFSSFIWNSFQALANLDPNYYHSRGRNVLELFAQLILTLCISIAALRFGAHCAQIMRHLLPSIRQVTKVKRYLDVLGVTLAIAGWAVVVVLAGLIRQWRAKLFTAILAPVGIQTLIFPR